METSLIASWIAAAVAMLALLANIILQIWSFDRRSKHEMKMQERQISFQEQTLKQSADNEYLSWLRDKRLLAMERAERSYTEVLRLTDAWSPVQNAQEEDWHAGVNASKEECLASMSSLRLVFGLHMKVMEHSNDVAKYSSKLCRLVVGPWGEDQDGKSWQEVVEEQDYFRRKMNSAYLKLWASMHSLTTPMPKSERWIFEEWMANPANHEEGTTDSK